MGKQQVQFIINPIAGGKQKSSFEGLVNKNLDLSRFEPYFAYTQHEGHGVQLARKAVDEQMDILVAVGGDGTINEVASALLDIGTPIAIIPLGSGNGLARFLKIPTDVDKAIQRINDGHVRFIDSGQMNGRAFFNMAGVGFDALVSNRFAENRTRGLIAYMKVIIREINNYKPKEYEIQIDGMKMTREAFMISIANSPQYGNNAYVSPKASLQDGLLDVCIIKQFPLYQFPMLIYQLFSRTTDQSEYVEIIKGKEITINRIDNDLVHLDGEPYGFDNRLDIVVLPNSLKVIC